MSKIKIEGMQFYAYHGCFPEERLVGTHFVVDCVLSLDVLKAAKMDDLELTINYQDAYRLIAKEMEQPSFLLENVAYRILKSLQKHFPILIFGEVNIRKMNPPLGGKVESVCVKMTTGELTKKVRKKV
jgi:dihydroneopterin aldolase